MPPQLQIDRLLYIVVACRLNQVKINCSKFRARDMGDSGNAELIRYFPQRHVWLAEPDLTPPRLSPYPLAADQRTPSRGTP